MAEYPGKFGFSVSHTTRDPRPGEKNGVDYHFIAKDEMQTRIAAGEFVEYAEAGEGFATGVRGFFQVSDHVGCSLCVFFVSEG